MRCLERVSELRAMVAGWRQAEESVGLVPTMGALHDGHLALVRQARAECQRVIATIFVNPLQFNESTDLQSYPRDQAGDLAKFEALDVDAVFMPPLDEVYPEGFATKITLPGLTDCLCGIHRPGHMDGVATVVAKLLIMAAPDRAYFGEKDYQQLLIVTRMARDLNLPVAIVGVVTVREPDGLALSSRNLLLSAENRERAPRLNQTLRDLAERLADDRTPAGPLLDKAREDLLAAGFEAIDYLDLRDAETLRTLEHAVPKARLFVAGWLGGVRLIDNLPINP